MIKSNDFLYFTNKEIGSYLISSDIAEILVIGGSDISSYHAFEKTETVNKINKK